MDLVDLLRSGVRQTSILPGWYTRSPSALTWSLSSPPLSLSLCVCVQGDGEVACLSDGGYPRSELSDSDEQRA